jgi:cell division protein FtsW
MASVTAAQDQSVRKKAAGLPFDGVLLVVVGALLAIGLMMVYSATFDWSYQLYGNPNTVFILQLRSLAVGLVAMFIASRVNYRWWRWLALGVMVASVVLLGWVLIKGSSVFGAQRSVFRGSVQPSELAKFATVVYLAAWLSSKGDKIRQWGYGIIPFGMIIGFITALILLQPDLSAAATIVIVACIMFFVAGADLIQMGLVGLAGSGVAWLVLQASETGRKRLVDYLAGMQDIMQASWQVQQAAIAFVNGGLFGRGLGQSYQKFGFLPTPHTDSIFAIIGEELGLLGCLVVVALFVVLIWRGFKIASEAQDGMGAILAAGIVCWVALESMVNIAVMVGALPVAGNALPFISYGGSNLVVMMMAMGVLLSISRRSDTEAMPRKTRSMGMLGDYAPFGGPNGSPAGEARRHATFDFGRRDGRGRLSRSGRRQ